MSTARGSAWTSQDRRDPADELPATIFGRRDLGLRYLHTSSLWSTIYRSCFIYTIACHLFTSNLISFGLSWLKCFVFFCRAYWWKFEFQGNVLSLFLLFSLSLDNFLPVVRHITWAFQMNPIVKRCEKNIIQLSFIVENFVQLAEKYLVPCNSSISSICKFFL